MVNVNSYQAYKGGTEGSDDVSVMYFVISEVSVAPAVSTCHLTCGLG